MLTTRVWAAALIIVATGAGALPSSAQPQLAQLYIANEWQESLQQLDFSTGTLTTLYNIGAKPDDLTLSSDGQLIYSVPNSGSVYMYDPVAGTNTLLCSGINGARDLTLEPGGQSILVSGYGDPAQIVRYSFLTNLTSVLFPKTKGITTMDGNAYDAYGNLYAVANHNTIIQISPVTGAILNTLTIQPHNGVNGGDGLTYDSYTNSMWAAADGKVLGYGLIQIPVQASGFVSTSLGFTFYPIPYGAPDGIKSDGNGNLYIGAIHTVLVYNIPNPNPTPSTPPVLVKNVVTHGADGVAPVPGTY